MGDRDGELAARDPLHARYLAAPYDPYASAQMAGRATGTVVRRPPTRGWTRHMAFVLALALLSIPLLGLATMLGPDSPLYSDGPVVEGARMLLLSAPFGFAGLLLLRRLIAPRREQPASGR
jgi:hypothetical protein